MGTRKHLWLAVIVLLLATCAPAAEATATPTVAPATRLPPATSAPSATAAPTPKAVSTPTTSRTQPKRGGTIVYPVLADPRAADPLRYGYSDIFQPLSMVHTRLTRFSPAMCQVYPYQPELAESWAWVNDTTMEFKLKKGVRYPSVAPVNGREMVAEDVVYSATVQWPKADSMAEAVKLIEKVVAVGKYTVRLQLKQTMGGYYEKLDNSGMALIMPPEIFGPKSDIEKLENNVGLGPFALKKYSPGVSMEFIRNEAYSTIQPGLPYLDGVRFYVMPDFSTQTSAFMAGRLDAIGFEDPTPAIPLERVPQLRAGDCGGVVIWALYMNATKAPFTDVRVRRAVSMAVDRQVLLSAVYSGKGTTTYTGIAPHFGDYFLRKEGYPQDVRKLLDYDPEGAKKLLAEAGLPSGFSTTIAFTRRFPPQQRAAEALVAMLGKAGINAKLQPLEYARFQEVVYGALFEEMAIANTGAGRDIDSSVWDPYHSTSVPRNRGRLSDPQLDRMMEAFRRTTDEAQRIKLAKEIQVYQVSSGNLVWMPVGNYPAYAQAHVKDFRPILNTKAWGDYFYNVWVDR